MSAMPRPAGYGDGDGEDDDDDDGDEDGENYVFGESIKKKGLRSQAPTASYGKKK